MHVKDRKLNNGPNVPFGQGDTPIKEVLQLMRDNKWNIQATIEFESRCSRAGSHDRIAKCIDSLQELPGGLATRLRRRATRATGQSLFASALRRFRANVVAMDACQHSSEHSVWLSSSLPPAWSDAVRSSDSQRGRRWYSPSLDWEHPLSKRRSVQVVLTCSMDQGWRRPRPGAVRPWPSRRSINQSPAV